MALIPTQVVTVDGLTPTFQAAAAGGDTAPMGDRYFLVAQNNDASSHDVQLATPGNLATGDAYPDKTYTVPNGQEVWLPLLRDYRDPADGLAHVTYPAGVTSLNVAVIRA